MSERHGFLTRLATLLGANLAYLRARLRLAGVEAKEAGVHYALIVALAIAALVAVIFGYLFFVIAVAFLLAWAFGGGNAWIWVTLAAAIAHFGAAIALLLLARAKLMQPMFEATLSEFKKDQQWLKDPAKQS